MEMSQRARQNHEGYGMRRHAHANVNVRVLERKKGNDHERRAHGTRGAGLNSKADETPDDEVAAVERARAPLRAI